jgi:mRNA-degrading endonuclease toxin of MazEF toxin-antitoxin module
MNRGDVLLVRYPHPSGGRGKKRPAVVVQADIYNAKLHSVLVAEITKNLAMANEPACLLIDISTVEGAATGVLTDSVVSCPLMATVKADKVERVIGYLSDALKKKLNDCLKAALGLL